MVEWTVEFKTLVRHWMKENYGPFSKTAIWFDDSHVSGSFRLLDGSDLYKYRKHWLLEVIPTGLVYMFDKNDRISPFDSRRPDFFPKIVEYLNTYILYLMMKHE